MATGAGGRGCFLDLRDHLSGDHNSVAGHADGAELLQGGPKRCSRLLWLHGSWRSWAT